MPKKRRAGPLAKYVAPPGPPPMPIGEKVDYVKKQGGAMTGHFCHWPGCGVQCKPAYWGCYAHWMKLPFALRREVWAAYRPGQERDKRPSREYVLVARKVQEWILTHYPETRKHASH